MKRCWAEFQELEGFATGFDCHRASCDVSQVDLVSFFSVPPFPALHWCCPS